MSRLTGNEVKSLMEAYSEVYVSQEISEDQVWEEVENWVNSLLEEGHDLSEYTWEEMYDAYIEEQGRGTRTGSNPKVFRPIPSGSGSRRGAAPVGTSSPSSTAVTSQRGRRTGSNPNVFRPATTTSGPAGGGMGGRRGGGSSPGSIKPSATKPAPTPAAKPVTKPAPTPAAKPTPAPAARPTPKPASTPAAKPTPTSTSTPKPTTPTASPAAKRPSLASQTAELRKMRAASQARQAGANVVGSQMASFDVFDVIKGYLLDEGYADSEKSALVIMANMSDEWRQNIVEVLDTPERANEYARKNVRSMLGAFVKGVANKDIGQMKTIKKRGEGAKMAKRKAERKAAEEES